MLNWHKSNSQGVFYALLSAFLFGLSTPFAKLLVGAIHPLMLAGLLYLGSGLGLSLLSLTERKANPGLIPIGSKQDWRHLAGAIIFGGILAPSLMLCGLTSISGAAGSLLLNLEGVLTALLAWCVFKENCDRRIVTGMFAISLGGIVLSLGQDSSLHFSSGCALTALACLCWAIDNNLTRQVSHADAKSITLIKGICAGSVNLILALSTGAAIPSVIPTLGALAVGFLGYGISLTLFVLALRQLGTARTGAYFSTAPFVGALGSIILLHEPISLSLGLAAIFMGAGVWLHVTEHHEHWHEHEELLHEHEHIHDEHHQHEHAADDPAGEPHTHVHQHGPLAHSHKHYPDLHHRHQH